MDDKLFEIARAFETLRASFAPSEYLKKEVVVEYDKALYLLRRYTQLEKKRDIIADANAAVDKLRELMPITLNMASPRFIRELAQLGWTQELIARFLGTNQEKISGRIAQATKEIATTVPDDPLSAILPDNLRDKPVSELTDDDRIMIAELRLYAIVRYGKANKDMLDGARSLINVYQERKIKKIADEGRKLKIGIEYLQTEFLPNLLRKLQLAGVAVDVKAMFKDGLKELLKRWEVTAVPETPLEEFDRQVKKERRRGKWIKKAEAENVQTKVD